MAPNAAQAIATLSVALALFISGRRRAMAGWLTVFVLFEAVLALLGYLHGTTSLYQFSRALRVSQYTASGLLLLSVAVLAAWPQGTAVHVLVRRTAGGLLARRVLPPLLAVPVLLGFLRNAGERAGLYDDALGTSLMTAGILLLVGVLIWHNARSLDRADEAQRRIVAENERLAAEAKAAVAVRDEFIALAAHELRTPLTAMQLQAQLEERRALQRGDHELHRWKRLIDRLARLVETMLDTSRIAQRQLELQRTDVELAALVRSTVERISPVLAAAQTAVRIQAEPDVRVQADALRIEQAVENVLLNAAKYGAGRDIEVAVIREDGFARLSIRDEGIGISPSDQERIFHRFERAAPSHNFGGLGLGLYLTRQVVQAHGGEISVESTPGQGATFHLRLPLANAPETPATA
jgi:signal transduction histidine kinase